MKGAAPSTLGHLLQQLASALRSAALYERGHPSIHTPLRGLATDFAILLRERDRIALGIVDDVLVIDEVPFFDAPLHHRAVCDALAAKQLDSIVFRPGVTLGELERVIELLADKGRFARLPLLEAAKQSALPHVSFRERVVFDEQPAGRARRTYDRTLAAVVDLASELRAGRIPTLGHTTAVIETMRDLILADGDALLGLTVQKSYDDFTHHHSVNVAIFSLAFGRYVGLGGDALERLGVAALLHDLGKLRTGDALDRKPGALTAEETVAMQRHPELGAELLGAMSGVDPESAEIVLHHHIRPDGGGYPALRTGGEPHPHGQIVALADCYDALTTTLPYQRSRHPSEAVRLLGRMAGTAYDTGTTRRFVEMIGSYPVGDVVRLSTDELAVVSRVTDLDAGAPRVRIACSADGVLLPAPFDCDLASEPPGGRVIAGSVDPVRKGIDVARVLGLQPS